MLLPNFNYSKVLYGSYDLGLFSISIISIVYLLLKKEVYDEIKKDDKVTFESEVISIFNEERNVARFVKKLKK